MGGGGRGREGDGGQEVERPKWSERWRMKAEGKRRGMEERATYTVACLCADADNVVTG